MEPREKRLDCIYRIDRPEETNDENNLDALLDLLPEFRVYRDEVGRSLPCQPEHRQARHQVGKERCERIRKGGSVTLARIRP